MVSLPSLRSVFPEFPDFESEASSQRTRHPSQPYPRPSFRPRAASDLPEYTYSSPRLSQPLSLPSASSLTNLSPHNSSSFRHPSENSSRGVSTRHSPTANAFIRDARTQYPSSTSCSFNVLKSDPSASSLEHIASSSGSSNASPLLLPRSPRHLPKSSHALPDLQTHNISTESDSGSVSDDDNISIGDDQGKRHVCPTCSKRFNRPSSLRIHVNTHTGATPYRCPWPNCGRLFNVNSNMRRHYRNHTATSNASPMGNYFPRHSTEGSASPQAATFLRYKPSVVAHTKSHLQTASV